MSVDRFLDRNGIDFVILAVHGQASSHGEGGEISVNRHIALALDRPLFAVDIDLFDVAVLVGRLRAGGALAVGDCLEMQPGDVYRTYADTSALERDFGYRPSTPLQSGIDRFCAWYKAFYGL